MTVQEKSYAIREYCKSKRHCTFKQEYPCPLYKSTGACSCGSLDNANIERNFKLVSAMPDYKGEKEDTTECKVDMAIEVEKRLREMEAVNHPSHYNQGGMECIDEMVLIFGKEATMNFCLCNAWKYRYRANAKNGQEDLEKANWYIAKYKELKEMA